MKKGPNPVQFVFNQILYDQEDGSIVPGKDTVEGKYPQLYYLLQDLMELNPLEAEIHVWSVMPQLFKDPEWREKVLKPVLSTMLDDKKTVLHTCNQNGWAAIKHKHAKGKGPNYYMKKLFLPNPEKGTAKMNVWWKRMCTLLLSQIDYMITPDRLEKMDILELGRDDVRDYYVNQPNKTGIPMKEWVELAEKKADKMVKNTDGLFGLIGKKGVEELTGHSNWRPGQVFETGRYFRKKSTKKRGVVKGNLMYAPWLQHDMVIYNWNTTDDIFPEFDLFYCVRAAGVHRPRTNWQACVFNKGIREWFPYIVKAWYQEALENADSFEDMLNTLAESRVEHKIEEDDEPDEDASEVEMDLITNIVRAAPVIGADMTYALRGMASKLVRLFSGGNSTRQKAKRMSVPWKKGWAFSAKIMPDLSGFDGQGIINFERCRLRKGEIACSQIEMGIKWFGWRLPVGSKHSFIYGTNTNDKWFRKCAPGTVFFNIVDAVEWLGVLDGGDFDDTLDAVIDEYVVKDAIAALHAWHPLDDVKVDIEWFKNHCKIPFVPDCRPTWENALKYRRKEFEEGKAVFVGFYAYIAARLHIVIESLPEFEDGSSYIRYFKTHRQWTEEDYGLFPHQRVDFLDLAVVKKLKNWQSEKEISLTALLDLVVDALPILKILFLSSRDNVRDAAGELIVFSEILIDLANQKPKYKKDSNGNWMPVPDVLGIIDSILEYFEEGLPGPLGRWTKGGLKFRTPMDDLFKGRIPSDALYKNKREKVDREGSNADDYGNGPLLCGRQWTSGIIVDGEFKEKFSKPRKIVKELAKNLKWAGSDPERSAISFKVLVADVMKIREEGKLRSLFRGIFKVAVEDNDEYYKQPHVYDATVYHYLTTDYKEWLQYKLGDDKLAEKELCITEGADSIIRRYEAELLNLLWQTWQNRGGKHPYLRKDATKEDVQLAMKVLYQYWLTGLQSVSYSEKKKRSDDEHEETPTYTLYDLLVKKYGIEAIEDAKEDPANAPFAKYFDFNESAALLEENLDEFCRWANEELVLI